MTSELRRTSGFTLLEMLVVLMIAGFALVLTIQAIGQFQRAHARISVHERAGVEYRLAESWFRNSARALVAVAERPLEATIDADSGTATFEGRSDGFIGLTLAPVLAGQGIPTLQRWRVVAGPGGGDALELEEEGQTLVLPFHGGAGLVLHYLDDEGGLHGQWPPRTLGEQPPQLPAAVVLELMPGAGGSGGGTIIAAVTGLRVPLELPYEPEPI